MRFLTVSIIVASLAMSGCATLKQHKTKEPLPAPHLIEVLPTDVGSFEYEGYRYFEDDSNGYTFRYTNPRKLRMADIYVYPVAEQNEDLDHEDLVMGSTRATIQAIGDAVKQGIYDNFNVVGAATQARGVRTVARVEATYLRQNLASYTLVYQTEYEGTLLKIRLSMPDNESNRASTEWDEFANTLFNEIVDELDELRVVSDKDKNTSSSRAQIRAARILDRG